MLMFARTVSLGNHVVEVGAHIGYITQFLAELVGPGGSVDSFEPSRSNRAYLRENTRELGNIRIHKEAVSNRNGFAQFYVEDLSGQNNSLLPQYAGLDSSQKAAHVRANIREESVPVTTLDDAIGDSPCHLVKIDIEGAELMALEGSRNLLRTQRPVIMVEITEKAASVQRLLREHGYVLVTPDGYLVDDVTAHEPNVFAFHPAQHRTALRALRLA